MEGTNITSLHIDHASYLADDAYCWTLGWLQGQGLDGSLMSNKPAWDALIQQECNKIGQALAEEFPEENHTVYRHVIWNRDWPQRLQCNIVEGQAPAIPGSTSHALNNTCIPVTENDL